jgi:hypothetical protein
MELGLNIDDITSPESMVQLNRVLRTLADECDTLYTTDAPNGSISARIGRRAIYNNSGTYTTWVNVDGATAWTRIQDYDANIISIASPARGAIPVNSSGGWIGLSPTTANSSMFLQSQGFGADPLYAKVNLGNTSHITGTAAIGNGGTGQITAQAALDALLPSQSGKSGQYLTTNGTTGSWGNAPLGYSLISTTVISNAASSTNIAIDKTKQYLVKVVLTAGSGGDNLRVQFNGDTGGANYQYTYYGYATSSAVIVTARSTSTSSIVLGPGNDPNTELNMDYDFCIYPQGTTSTKGVAIAGSLIDALSAQLIQFFGLWRGTADVTYFNVLKTGGSLFTGTVYLYELKTA